MIDYLPQFINVYIVKKIIYGLKSLENKGGINGW